MLPFRDATDILRAEHSRSAGRPIPPDERVEKSERLQQYTMDSPPILSVRPADSRPSLSAESCLAALALSLLAGSLHAADAPPKAASDLKQRIVAHHARLVHANYEDALIGARLFQSTTTAFIATPNDQTHALAKQAWLHARTPYAQTETCRFYEGPIEEVETMINAWPIDEQYVDYVEGSPDAGVINQPDRFPRITKELILSLNEQEGEKNISTGYHVIEFLLWGQDLFKDGPGRRSFKDYTPAAQNSERRAAYLKLATELLVGKLEYVVGQWAPGKADNYRSKLIAMPPDEAFANILRGMGSLSGPELAGERMTVAYETKEQEDEHSCFSDNTHMDIVYNTIGVQNVFLGRYIRTNGLEIKGPGIHDLIASVAPDKARDLKKQLERSVAATRAIPVPFDQAFLGRSNAPGRQALRAAIKSLLKQSELIAKSASALGIRLNI